MEIAGPRCTTKLLPSQLKALIKFSITPDNNPLHPACAIPTIEPSDSANKRKHQIAGEIPSPLKPPSGCYFRTRCPYAQDKCRQEEPQFRELMNGHFVSCHFPL